MKTQALALMAAAILIGCGGDKTDQGEVLSEPAGGASAPAEGIGGGNPSMGDPAGSKEGTNNQSGADSD